MSQTRIDLTNHIGFQLSLLRLSTIPGPSGVSATDVGQETKQLELLASRVLTPVNR
jgi:hypothetical protein